MNGTRRAGALLLLALASGAACASSERAAQDHGEGAGIDAGPKVGAADAGSDVLTDPGLIPEGGGPSAACLAAETGQASVGCDYWATFMDIDMRNGCFAAVVANTSSAPAHVSVDYDGKSLDVETFTRVPTRSGPSLTYAAFDGNAGLAPGEVAILFLSGPTGEPGPFEAPCPVPSAVPDGVLVGTGDLDTTGIGKSFHLATDVPVVAYQINPYGGGSAAVTGASLLLPTSVWDTNYVAVNAYGPGNDGYPSLNIVASEDQTHVTLLPSADVTGGPGIPAGAAHVPLTITLDRGQHAQISQAAELSGSIVQSDKPIGVMAGHQCMVIPSTSGGPCDHGEQMLPPIRALGSTYVGVMYSPRTTEPAIWRVIGAVDGTTLTWSTDVGGPATLARGQVVEFISGTPFVVASQDKDHPFILFEHMSSNGWDQETYYLYKIGDPDSVLGVPPDQFMNDYVFFADPTYPVSNLVVVRTKVNGAFADVNLDCAGTLGDWQPVGDYEYTRVFLNNGDFQPVGGCDTGRHEMKSQAPFGLWVWGWGGPWTQEDDGGGVSTQSVSYAYPAGMSVAPINQVLIPPR